MKSLSCIAFGKLLIGCDRRDFSNQQQHNYVLRMIFSFLDCWTLIRRVSLTNREFYRTIHEGLLIAPNYKQIVDEFLPIQTTNSDENINTSPLLTVFAQFNPESQNGKSYQTRTTQTFKSWRNTWNITPDVQAVIPIRKILASNMIHYDKRVEYLHVICNLVGENGKQVFDNCISKMFTIFMQSNTRNVKHLEFESSCFSDNAENIEVDSPIFSTISKLFTLENYGIGLFNSLEGLILKLPSNTEIAKLFLELIKKHSSNDHHANQWTLRHLDLDFGMNCNAITIGDVLSQCKNILCSRNGVRDNLLLESFRCNLTIKTLQDVFLFNSLFTGFQGTALSFVDQPKCNLKELCLCFDMLNIFCSPHSLNFEESVECLTSMLDKIAKFTKIKQLNFTLTNISSWKQLEWLGRLNSTLINLSLTCIFKTSRMQNEISNYNIESCKYLSITEECHNLNFFMIPNIFPNLTEIRVSSKNSISLISKLIAPNLESLTLCGISVPSGSNTWSYCSSNLKSIYISKSSIQETEGLFNNCTKMESIVCEESTFNSYPNFGIFTNLEHLKFPNSGVFDCKSIAFLKHLKVFILKSFPQQRVLNVQCLEHLENLVLLDLTGCNRFVFNENNITRETCELSSLDISKLKRLEFLNMDNAPIITQNFGIHPSWAKQMHKMWIEIKTLISHPIEMDNYKIDESVLTSIFQNQKNKYLTETHSKNNLRFGLDFKLISNKVLEYLREKSDFMEMGYRQGFFNNELTGAHSTNFGETIVGTLTIDNLFKTRDILSLIYTFRFYKSNQIMVGSIKFSHNEGQDIVFCNAFDRTLSKTRKTVELYKSAVGGIYSTAVLQKELEQVGYEEPTTHEENDNIANLGFGKSELIPADNQSCVFM